MARNMQTSLLKRIDMYASFSYFAKAGVSVWAWTSHLVVLGWRTQTVMELLS
jgi:hypothetical protein